MKRLFYALFEDRAAAAAAIGDLQYGSDSVPNCTVVMHSGPLSDSGLARGETRAGAGSLQVALLSAVAGALTAGLILSPAGMIALSPWAAAAAVGAAAGVFGALAGALSGSSVVDPVMVALAPEMEQGKVVVAVTAPSLELRAVAEGRLKRHGALVSEPHFP